MWILSATVANHSQIFISILWWCSLKSFNSAIAKKVSNGVLAVNCICDCEVRHHLPKKQNCNGEHQCGPVHLQTKIVLPCMSFNCQSKAPNSIQMVDARCHSTLSLIDPMTMHNNLTAHTCFTFNKGSRSQEIILHQVIRVLGPLLQRQSNKMCLFGAFLWHVVPCNSPH